MLVQMTTTSWYHAAALFAGKSRQAVVRYGTSRRRCLHLPMRCSPVPPLSVLPNCESAGHVGNL
jgi:hypothetical protein